MNELSKLSKPAGDIGPGGVERSAVNLQMHTDDDGTRPPEEHDVLTGGRAGWTGLRIVVRAEGAGCHDERSGGDQDQDASARTWICEHARGS